MTDPLAPTLPPPTAAGLFLPVIGRAPAAWPWALPALYAVNVVEGTTEVLASVAADPGGRSGDRRRTARVGWIEVIGFWAGHFGVVSTELVWSLGAARVSARTTFRQLPVRYRMEGGRIQEQNPTVELTGTWPGTWTFRRLSDLGVLCAYIHDQIQTAGGEANAAAFRRLVDPATPGTEQLLVYVRALTYARSACAPWLSPSARTHLEHGLAAAKAWASR